MAAADVAILITADNRASAELKKVAGNLKEVERSAQGTTGGMSGLTAASGKLNGALGTVAKTAAGFLAANVITKGVGFFSSQLGSIISGASDLNESMSKSSVVFGAFNNQVKDFAASSAKSFGISRQAAFEATSTFGNLFTAMGLGQKEAADLSVPLVKLAADLASFNNISIDDALIKLRAGLVGEAEPLRTLGVQINAATVEAKAMQLGLQDANGVISESAKVQARYALILEQTKTAQGDFARTSGGLANQQRILKASFADLKAGIGQALLPVVTAFVKLLAAKVVPSLVSVSTHLQTFASLIKASLKGDLTKAAELFNKLPRPLQVLSLWLGKNEESIKGFLSGVADAVQGVAAGIAAFAQWTKDSGLLDNALLGLKTIGEALKVTIEALAPVVKKVIDFFEKHKIAALALGLALAVAFAPGITAILGLIVAIGYLRRHFDDIKRKTKEIWGAIPDPIKDALQFIVDLAENQFQQLKNIVETAYKVVSGIFKTLKAVWQGDWSAAWEGLKQIGTALFDGFVRDIQLKLGALRDSFTFTFAAVKGIVSAAFEAMKTAASAALNWIIDRINTLIDKINGLGDAFGKIGINLPDVPKVPNVDTRPPLGAPGGSTRGGHLDSFASGTPFVPRDMLAQLHRGERVVPAAMNATGEWGGNLSLTFNISGANAHDNAREVQKILRDELGVQTLAGPRLPAGAFSPRRA